MEFGAPPSYPPRVTTRIVLGPEFDEDLRATVLAILTDMGAHLEPSQWGMAGSQELSTQYATLNGERLKLEAETYFGLSLSGDRTTVETVAERVRERRQA
jgi:hypothetical protein